MPNYDYHCEKCQEGFVCFQSMKDDPLQVCPKELCRKKTWGKGKVKRQIGTGAGLIFKGSGFYITDYRSENYKSAAKSDSASGTSGASGASGTPASTGSSTPSTPSKPSTSSGSGKAEKSS